jgi:hypothetical protein
MLFVCEIFKRREKHRCDEYQCMLGFLGKNKNRMKFITTIYSYKPTVHVQASMK